MTYIEAAPFALAILSLATLGAVLLKDRKLRLHGIELDEREMDITKAEASIRALQDRAASLSDEVDRLEEQRDALLVVVPETAKSERRTKLAERVAAAAGRL
jgi:cell division protein FtsB